ncbi:MAG: hypothetical protein KIS63_03065 [Caldilineales bacterium]|nr:hypothetical protein [Caldilineales bacterium]
MNQILSSILLIVMLASPFGMTPPTFAAQSEHSQAAPRADPPVPSRYTITDLGTLGGDTSQAFGINKEGQVVGLAKLPSQVYHAFSWGDETMSDLGTLGGQQSSAEDINNAGQIVGWSHTSSGDRAFLWQNGSMQSLGTLGGTGSAARGINTAGQIVGSANIAGNAASHAFLWQNGTMQDLDTLGGLHSYGYDINDAGQVIGISMVPSDPPGLQHAFLWQNGSLQDIGVLASSGASAAYAINSAGQIVGGANVLGGGHAFLWQNGAARDLGALSGANSALAYDINDAGQVVGESLLTVQGYHAFIWENGQMQDLNNLIPANSGWLLRQARGINKRGQIVGYGVINRQAHAYLLTPRPSVLIVPGIAGTYAANQFFDYPWVIHRGVNPTDLQVDPLGKVYHDLIQTFENLGYEEGKDLFVVNYDWRLLPGPIDNQFDGHISGLNAQTLADEQFTYAVDYLGYYLRKASEAYRTRYGGELPEVNIIAHSTGGLVARSYIQSDAYGGEYDLAKHYKLPTIDQFIMVGVPNRGASKAWNPLHNNWISDVAYRAVLSKIVNRAFQKVMPLLPTVIQGPDHNITKASITANGVVSPTLFIEQYVPTIRSLLATYDFLDSGSGYANVNSDPAWRNNSILDLNNGLDLRPTVDPNLFASQTQTTVICGASERTANLVVERTGTAADGVLLPFSEFSANDAGATDEWYEDQWLAYGGDGTVPLESCRDQFLGDGRVAIRLFSSGGNTSGDTTHTGLMSNIDVQSAILDILGIKYDKPNDFSTGHWLNPLSVIGVIVDPVNAVLVDGAGRRLGYSTTDGVFTEIPGSLWFGDANGIGYVFGGFAAPLHLELTGLGEDYYVMAAVEQDGRPIGGAIGSGHLAAGQVAMVPISLPGPVFLPMIAR